MSKVKLAASAAKSTETVATKPAKIAAAKPAKPATPIAPAVEIAPPVAVATKKPAAKKSESSPDDANPVKYTGKEITARVGSQREVNLRAMIAAKTVGELRKIAPNQSWITWAMNNGFITL